MNGLSRLPQSQHRAAVAHALPHLFVVRGALYPAHRVTLALPKDERSKLRTKALTDWLAMGHSEQQIRQLVAGAEVPLAPTGLDAAPASAPPSKTKRR